MSGSRSVGTIMRSRTHTYTAIPFSAVPLGERSHARCTTECACRLRHRVVAVLMWVFVSLPPCFAWPSSYRSENLDLRGKSQSLAVYEPKAGEQVRPFQILVTSGDVGWVGLGVEVAEHFSRLGYRVIGFNARAYLSSFTGDKGRLQEKDIPGDYQTILDWAASKAPSGNFILIGVSEGAGLSVVGMGQGQASKRCKGIIALGLPVRTSLGWRWTDFPMWISKRDPNEPQAETQNYLKGLTVPIVVINSTHDEWDSIDKVKAIFEAAPQPKRFIPIAASNHRFSDKVSEVLTQIEASLQWLANLQTVGKDRGVP